MKKILFIILLFSGGLVHAGLLPNGDFKNGITGWKPQCAWKLAPGLKSAQCLAINGIGFCESAPITVSPGTVYRVAAWAYTDKDEFNLSHIKVKWFDKQDDLLSWETVERMSFSSQWTRYAEKILSPPGATRAVIVLYGHAFEATSYFENVSFDPSRKNEDRSVLLYRFDGVTDYFMKDYSGYGNTARVKFFDPEQYVATEFGRRIEMIKWVPTYFYAERSEALRPGEDYLLAMKFFFDGGGRIPPNGMMSLIDSREVSLTVNKNIELCARLGGVPLPGLKLKEYQYYELELGYDKKAAEAFLRVRALGPDRFYEDYRTGAFQKQPWDEKRVKATVNAIAAPPINEGKDASIVDGLYISTPQLYPGTGQKTCGFNGVLVELRIQN